MARPAGGHISDEKLLKLAPLVSPERIVTGIQDRLPDVGVSIQKDLIHYLNFNGISILCVCVNNYKFEKG